MSDSKILWKDTGISFYNMFVIYSTMALLLITPLIPLAFWKFEKVRNYIILFYLVNGIIFLFLALHLYYEKKRWLYFNQNGIVIKWKPETGDTYEMFGWHHLKRINLLSSWSPKSYLRWKRIKKDLSYSLFFASALYDNMLIIETKKENLFFVGINDFKGFMTLLNQTKNKNHYLKQIPVMNYGVKW